MNILPYRSKYISCFASRKVPRSNEESIPPYSSVIRRRRRCALSFEMTDLTLPSCAC